MNFFSRSGMPSVRRRRWPIGIVDFDFVGHGAVVEFDLERVGDGAFFGVEVVAGVGGVFFDDHLGAEEVDARVGGVESVFVVFGDEVAVEESDGDHVLKAVVAVGGVVQRAALGNDADGGFVRGDADGADVVRGALTAMGWSVTAASTAVWAWNSAGNEILKRMCSIT